jgi:hypothetical protein
VPGWLTLPKRSVAEPASVSVLPGTAASGTLMVNAALALAIGGEIARASLSVNAP